MRLILFSTAGCHLCEQAVSLIQTVCHHHCELIITEIGDDEELVQRYGILIPVLQFPDKQELNWPFTEDDIQRLLSQQN